MATDPTLRLVATEGPAVGNTTSLDAPIIIGTAPTVDVVLDEPDIAPHHTALRPVADGVEIEDLGSPAGTFVNGRRIETATRLSVGDEIKVGGSVFEIQEAVETEADAGARPLAATEVVDALTALVRGEEERERATREAHEQIEKEQQEEARRRAEEKARAKEAKAEEKRRAKETKAEEKRRAEEAKAEERRRAEEAKAEERRRAEEAKAEERRRAEEAKAEERRRAEEAKRAAAAPRAEEVTRERVEPEEPPAPEEESATTATGLEHPVDPRTVELPARTQRRWPSPRSPRVLIAAGVIAAVAAGTYFVTRGPSSAGFIAEVRDVCATARPPGEPLRAIDPSRLQRLGDRVSRVQRARLDVLSGIDALEAPEDLDPKLPRFLSAFRKTNRALGDLQLSVAAGRQGGVNTSRAALLSRAQAERRTARQLGTPECGGLGIV